jgi:hypothetical protein
MRKINENKHILALSMVVLCLCLVFALESPIFSAALPNVIVEGGKAYPGETVNIPVIIDDPAGMASFGVELKYDPAVLTPVDIVNGDVIQGAINKNLKYGENAVYANIAVANAAANGGTLLIAKFQVNDNAKLGNTSITIGDDTSFEDEAAKAVNVNIVNGILEIIKVDEPAAVHTIAINGLDNITIPVKDSTTRQYTAVVNDQYGNEMAGEQVTWSLAAPVNGVSVDPATGVVTVDSNAVDGTFTLKAVSNTNEDVFGEKNVQINKDAEKERIKSLMGFLSKFASLNNAQFDLLIKLSKDVIEQNVIEVDKIASKAELLAVIDAVNEVIYATPNDAQAFKNAINNQDYDTLHQYYLKIKKAIPSEIKQALKNRGFTEDELIAAGLEVMQQNIDYFVLAEAERGIINNILDKHAIDEQDRIWLASYGINYDNLVAFLNGLTATEQSDLRIILQILTGYIVPGGGGGGGGGGSTPANVLEKNEAVKQINDGKAQVVFNAPASSEEVIINADAYKAIAEAGKDLVIKIGNVTLTIPANTFDATLNEPIKFNVKKLTSADQKKYADQAGASFKILDAVYEITCNQKINKPVNVNIAYDDKDVNEDKLDAYWYDEAAGKWVSMNGTVDKAKNVLGFVTTHFSKYAVMEYKGTFVDIINHWAQKDIEFLADKGIVKGISATEYAPNALVTRSQFAALLVRALGLDSDPAYKLTFKDVDANKWYYGEVAAAYKAGIVKGLNDSTFAPNANISREEMAAMVTRAMASAGKKLDLSDAQIQQKLAVFKDASGIAAWAKGEVAKAVELGIVKGRTEDTFVAKANATRAESATMIKRMYDQLH